MPRKYEMRKMRNIEIKGNQGNTKELRDRHNKKQGQIITDEIQEKRMVDEESYRKTSDKRGKGKILM